MKKELFFRLPKLLSVLSIFALGFAVLSGFLALLFFYIILTGMPETERRAPITLCVSIVLVLSLPFFTHAICGFISGERSFKSLLVGSLKPGIWLYLKFLAVGVVAYGLSYLIRFLDISSVLQILLAVVIFVCSLPVSYRMYKNNETILLQESAKNRDAIFLASREAS